MQLIAQRRTNEGCRYGGRAFMDKVRVRAVLSQLHGMRGPITYLAEGGQRARLVGGSVAEGERGFRDSRLIGLITATPLAPSATAR